MVSKMAADTLAVEKRLESLNAERKRIVAELLANEAVPSYPRLAHMTFIPYTHARKFIFEDWLTRIESVGRESRRNQQRGKPSLIISMSMNIDQF